jgi:hypothetical protein
MFLSQKGGNDLEGLTIPQRFNWTATIGPLRYRPGRLGTWDGYATGGLGLMEVFDWAESVNIKPLLGIYGEIFFSLVLTLGDIYFTVFFVCSRILSRWLFCSEYHCA